MKKQTKCYIYTRVSTAMQVDGYSLDAQKEKLRNYAAYQDMTIVGEYSDEGFSGKNIRTQTMAGREQKAREGKWNGGFAPYGYRLENGELLIAEDEVEVIRAIYDRYIHTNDGISGVAKYLNRQGFKKKLRQNGTIPGFSTSFVKAVLDNPVYMGKIAYGRRRTEKKLGTRNEMHTVEQSEFPIYEGQHEAIISEDAWKLAKEKRKSNAYRREKVNDPKHAHILSGILKCPCCGKSLYGNIAKAHSKDNKTRYYYYCKNTVTPTGHECTFRLNIEQTEMNDMVARIISAMVNDPRFSTAIKEKIGVAVDTADMEGQLDQEYYFQVPSSGEWTGSERTTLGK